MTISYNWLLEYIPESYYNTPDLQPEKLASILTAIGLEVESLQKKETVKGGFNGLVAGEVLTCEKHPDADKLKLTTVDIGKEILSIVCGASNVAAGQKVVVAPAGTTIYPLNGDPVTLKKTKIRGAESQGMICAEDEIGLSNDHDGIMILPPDTIKGKPVSEIFENKEDHLIEIGLTPNRTDAMSHYGVARDLCAYLSYHSGKTIEPALPKGEELPGSSSILVEIENAQACRRYSGALIEGITVSESPEWLRNKLVGIDVKPINNIVDITNFILHESGQPLHAFDADKITGNKVIVKNPGEGTSFITLDNKERKLHATDLMICNAEEPMCIAGVYGGIKSGVTENTKRIFLESAHFTSFSIRKTSLAHNLRTDAAIRFEKGTDISKTADVLQRAVSLILQLAGGSAKGMIDVYPVKQQDAEINLDLNYLHRLSGKAYRLNDVKNILSSLGFEMLSETEEHVTVRVPSYKTDISQPCDLVEEIMRIDGLDNIEIPSSITIDPAPEKLSAKLNLREKISTFLSASFNEIFTNSLTSSRQYDEKELGTAVKMINSLSNELDVLRMEMLNSGLSSLAYNINRKNGDLRFYEFGKTYHHKENTFSEIEQLALYLTGNINENDWQHKSEKASLFHLKGIVIQIFSICGAGEPVFLPVNEPGLSEALHISYRNNVIGICGSVSPEHLKKHDLKQPVFFANLQWLNFLNRKNNDQYKEISRFPAAQRDLSMVLDKKIPFSDIEKTTRKVKIANLTSVQLFDVFESEKLGDNKKSVALNFTFADDTKTLTDSEIDAMVQQLVNAYAKELNAEIRK